MYNWILDFSLEYSRDEYLGLCFFSFGSLTETLDQIMNVYMNVVILLEIIFQEALRQRRCSNLSPFCSGI
jgi:hypothetical protein